MENIDTNFEGNNRNQILQKYSTAFRQLRTFAELNYNVRSFYFENFVLSNYFQASDQVEQQTSNSETSANARESRLLAHFKLELLQHILNRRRQIILWLFYVLLLCTCVIVYRGTGNTTNLISGEQTMQYVNPGMRLWRRMTLPLIQRFPRLTELYDESCLMENPFFQLDLPCEPCAGVERVLELTQQSAVNKKESNHIDAPNAEYVPFVFKVSMDKANIIQYLCFLFLLKFRLIKQTLSSMIFIIYMPTIKKSSKEMHIVCSQPIEMSPIWKNFLLNLITHKLIICIVYGVVIACCQPVYYVNYLPDPQVFPIRVLH